MNGKQRLSELQLGDTCRILAIESENENLKKRMMHLGFLKGQNAEVVFRNSSKSPLTVRVRGTLIALRQIEADSIFIERDSNE